MPLPNSPQFFKENNTFYTILESDTIEKNYLLNIMPLLFVSYGL